MFKLSRVLNNAQVATTTTTATKTTTTTTTTTTYTRATIIHWRLIIIWLANEGCALSHRIAYVLEELVSSVAGIGHVKTQSVWLRLCGWRPAESRPRSDGISR